MLRLSSLAKDIGFSCTTSTALKIGRFLKDPGATQAALYHLQLDGVVDPRIDNALREEAKIAEYFHKSSPAVIFPLERSPYFRIFPLDFDVIDELEQMLEDADIKALPLITTIYVLWDFVESTYRFKDIDPEVKKIAEELERGEIKDLVEKMRYVLGKYFPYI